MRKYVQGVKINSLDEMLEQEFIIFEGKVYHSEWFSYWHIKTALSWIEQGRIYKAVTNEKSKGKTIYEDFIEKYPNIKYEGSCPSICPSHLGYKDRCNQPCSKCWAQLLSDYEK